MKWLIDKIGKAGAFMVAFLGIITAFITIYQFIYSTPKHNLAGVWKLTFVVKNSSYRAYIGESHTQKINFCQNGFEVSGDGEKWEYNGKLLPFDAHRKLEYKGGIENDLLRATYKLFGLRRESSGSIEVKISEDGKTLAGTFYGTAADSRGTVTGERLD